MRTPDYAKHYEILMAVVTHLAVNRWCIRQPKGIAKDLSIDDVDSVRDVLKTFKGLFRESQGTSKDHGDHYYSLHLRYARDASGVSDEERPPLDPDTLFSLLRFVSDKSAQQSQQATSLRVAVITSIISLIVAAFSMVVALHKS
ncbi:hypothetical protein ACQR0V_12170 [Bradyrhizobium sp. HKCCYLS2058]|uniref:hypothetical protein n=1 Tax=unclassified Bradyrhizobium TaxID=2631580 RepID=UPI003EBBAEBE